MADETTVTKNLWTEHLGKGFAAKQADYAIRASEDVNGTSLTLTVDSESDTVTRIGGKKIAAKTAETDINGKSLELTVVNNSITAIGGKTITGTESVFVARYNSTRGDAITAALNSGKVVISTYYNGDIGILTYQDKANHKYGFTCVKKISNQLGQTPGTIEFHGWFCNGASDSWFGQHYTMKIPAPGSNDAGKVLSAYVDPNTSYPNYRLDTINQVPSSTSSDEGKVLAVNAQGTPAWATVQGYATDPTIDDSLLLGQSDGSKTWTALNRDVFGTVMLDENDLPVLDESSTQDNPVLVYDADSTDDLWTSFANHEFGARRAYEDQDGNNIKATYARKDETSGPDEATNGEVDSIVITYGSVVIGGRTYKTVTIGNQEWLAENLDYKFDGLEIGEEDTMVKAVANYYDGDEATYGRYGNRYGLLYNWKAVHDLDTNQATLLPSDWHVPTEAEWTTLLTEVGGASVAGAKLKSFSDWSSGNGDDPYGMSIYPCGDYNTGGNEYENINVRAWFWTATENSASNNAEAVRFADDDDNAALQRSNPKSLGYSVRLVRTIS